MPGQNGRIDSRPPNAARGAENRNKHVLVYPKP
jgi:hypothetical protein